MFNIVFVNTLLFVTCGKILASIPWCVFLERGILF